MKEKITELRHLIAIFGNIFYAINIYPDEIRLQTSWNLKVIRKARHMGYTFERQGNFEWCKKDGHVIIVEI